MGPRASFRCKKWFVEFCENNILCNFSMTSSTSQFWIQGRPFMTIDGKGWVSFKSDFIRPGFYT